MPPWKATMPLRYDRLISSLCTTRGVPEILAVPGQALATGGGGLAGGEHVEVGVELVEQRRLGRAHGVAARRRPVRLAVPGQTSDQRRRRLAGDDGERGGIVDGEDIAPVAEPRAGSDAGVVPAVPGESHDVHLLPVARLDDGDDL